MSQERENTLALLQEKETNELARHQRQTEIRSEQNLQTNLNREWQTEHSMIQLCRTITGVEGEKGRHSKKTLIVRSEIYPEKFRFVPTEAHDLVVVQRVLKQSREDPSLAFHIPSGLEEYRNKILRKFTVSTNIDQLRYRLPESEQVSAMDMIGDMIVAVSTEPNELQELLEGEYQEKREILAAEISSAIAGIESTRLASGLSTGAPRV